VELAEYNIINLYYKFIPYKLQSNLCSFLGRKLPYSIIERVWIA